VAEPVLSADNTATTRPVLQPSTAQVAAGGERMLSADNIRPASPTAVLPEPRPAAPAHGAPPAVDWQDVPAFAEAIWQALSQEKISELTEALINKLG
jgi:hypothetical protein